VPPREASCAPQALISSAGSVSALTNLTSLAMGRVSWSLANDFSGMAPLAALRQLRQLALEDVACSQQGWALLAQLPALARVLLGALSIGAAPPAALQVLEVAGNLELALPGARGRAGALGPWAQGGLAPPTCLPAPAGTARRCRRRRSRCACARAAGRPAQRPAPTAPPPPPSLPPSPAGDRLEACLSRQLPSLGVLRVLGTASMGPLLRALRCHPALREMRAEAEHSNGVMVRRPLPRLRRCRCMLARGS
jgi:hypothetical protein